MPFFARLQQQTEHERQELLALPLIQRAQRGEISRTEYVAFLTQAYHHVKHTVPLLMAVGARLPEEKEWLRVAVAEYIEEEIGHQEWILNDIAACGHDKEAVLQGHPNSATELMVAYAYDTVQRVNPLGFFGMVHVLEGVSIAVADRAATGMLEALQLPKSAFSYLYSHGSLDQQHVQFFEGLMNKIQAPDEQAVILHCARIFYGLYGNIFRSLEAATPPYQNTSQQEAGYALS